jgi:predicted oxidoreductase (fatty acid repression mutant protein)
MKLEYTPEERERRNKIKAWTWKRRRSLYNLESHYDIPDEDFDAMIQFIHEEYPKPQ